MTIGNADINKMIIFNAPAYGKTKKTDAKFFIRCKHNKKIRPSCMNGRVNS